MATARTEMGRASPKQQQNTLKAKTPVKRRRQLKYTKTKDERRRTRSGEKKTGMGHKNAT